MSKKITIDEKHTIEYNLRKLYNKAILLYEKDNNMKIKRLTIQLKKEKNEVFR